ncbi:HNH endonuclease signature motif containing protein [Nocardioides rubriscoriae]|uniref:HNH endonuclease signature motif containing protein n=1 Tax=Nocardioides rubriscoriae TaxID=642762 RepID=UPI0014783D56|nr:HNH endonuclease signature motif containing protein [Nocardioides rubriscoriae]
MLSPCTLSPAAVLATAGSQLGELRERLWAGVGHEDLVDGLQALEALTAQAAALRAQLLTEVDHREIPRRQLSWASTHEWYAHLAGLTVGEARKAVVHARALTSERSATFEALAAGEVSPRQAGIVCDAVEDLPPGPALRAQAEQTLLAEATRLDATDLRKAARHLADVVDPDRAERKAEAELDREERAAHLKRFFAVTDDGAGGVRIKGRGSVEDAAILRAALIPLTKPSPAVDPEQPDEPDHVDPRDHGARMWDALVGLAQHSLDTDLQPASHGARPRVGVLIDLDDLRHGTGTAGTTEDGLTLSVSAVRRLACDADILPVCLGTEGQVLDVGRTHRLVTMALWLALIARDRHCAFPGCSRPPVMCHGHHVRHWADGGATALDNLVMLCGAHHRVIHHSPWEVRLSPVDGRPEFRPPPRRRGDPPPEEWIRHRPRRV